MSLILDALRKSERSRQQSLTGKVGAADAAPGRTRLPVPWAAILGLLLLVNAIAVGLLLWGKGTAKNASANTVTASPPAMPYRPAVRPLAEEASDAAVNPTTAAPSMPSASTSSAVPIPQTAPADAATLPTLDSLPADFRASLPALHLDVHGYTGKPADRFAVINMQNVRAGDTLAGDLRVVDIVPQGVILEYHGTRFLLPTP